MLNHEDQLRADSLAAEIAFELGLPRCMRVRADDRGLTFYVVVIHDGREYERFLPLVKALDMMEGWRFDDLSVCPECGSGTVGWRNWQRDAECYYCKHNWSLRREEA